MRRSSHSTTPRYQGRHRDGHERALADGGQPQGNGHDSEHHREHRSKHHSEHRSETDSETDSERPGKPSSEPGSQPSSQPGSQPSSELRSELRSERGSERGRRNGNEKGTAGDDSGETGHGGEPGNGHRNGSVLAGHGPAQATATAPPLTATARPVRWVPLVVLLAVIALLAGGWNLISSWLPDLEPVAPGTVLPVGPATDGVRPASVTVADAGWQMRQGASNPDASYVLTRDGANLTVRHLNPPSATTDAALWDGLRELARVGRATLGSPSTIDNDAGQTGQTGSLTLGDRSGTTYAFLAPDGTHAVQVSFLAAEGSPGAAPESTDRADSSELAASAEQVARSVTFHRGPS